MPLMGPATSADGVERTGDSSTMDCARNATRSGGGQKRRKIENTEFIELEVIVENLARIRDVDVDRGGLVYLLLEHDSGSHIVRLIPD